MIEMVGLILGSNYADYIWLVYLIAGTVLVLFISSLFDIFHALFKMVGRWS